MPQEQQLIIHVGAHKTASSLLQSALRAHGSELSEAGLAVVHRPQLIGSDLASALKGVVTTGAVPEPDATERAARSLRTLTAGDEPSVLLTNEDLLETFRRPQFYNHVGPALGWMQGLTDGQLSVILYTRTQPDYVESMYMQRIHLGDSAPFPKVRRIYDRLDLSWSRVLDEMTRVIGSDHVTAIPYESITRVGASAYYRDFLRACGIEPSDALALPERLVTSRSANRSYSGEAMKIASAVNPLLDAESRPKLRRFLQENYSTASHARAVLFDEAAREAFLDPYRESNRRLFEVYMPSWQRDAAAYGVERAPAPSAAARDRIRHTRVIAPFLGPTLPDVSVTQRRTTGILDVLVPHYRDIAGLWASLNSVAQQTWVGDLRVVIVDDGSEPEIFAEVERLVAAQPFPVTIHRFEQNQGRPRVRNQLLREVDAPYVAWLDAGDVWYPDKLKVQFDHLRHLELEGFDLDRVWVTCHFDWDQHGDVHRVLQRTTADQLSDLLIGDKLRAYLWTLLGRTAAFRAAGMFDEALPRLQDLDYVIRFVNAGGVLTAPPTRMPLCRYDKSDVGRKHEEVAACARLIMRKYQPVYAQYGPGFVARARWKNAKLAARYALNNKSYGAAFKYLSTTLATNPRYTAYKVRRRLIGR